MVGVLDVEKEDIMTPFRDDRFKEIDFLNPIKEKILESNRLAYNYISTISGIAGLSAPTGIGKTVFITSLATALAKIKKEEGDTGKIVIVTSSKETRTEIMARLIEQVHIMKKRGIEPPNILVVFSKLDTCINNMKPIREILDDIRAEEKVSNPDTNKIQKLSYLFYNRCNRLVRNGRCVFYNNAQTNGEKIAETIIGNGYLYIIGSLTDETVRRIKRISETISKLAESEGVRLPYTVDVKTIAESYNVCPYELTSLLARKADIVVIDSIYLSFHLYSKVNFIKYILDRNSIVLVDETHELFKNRYPSIIVSSESPISLTGLEKELLSTIDEIISKYEIGEARYDTGDYEVRIAVPESSLDKKYLNIMKSVIRRARKRLRRVEQSKARIVESDILILEDALLNEPRYSVSDNANRGILAFMGLYKNGKIVEGRIIPTVFSKKLVSGRDFREIIHFSATLLPHHLSMLHHIRREYAEKLIATVEWDVIKKNRKTVLLQVKSNYGNRSYIMEIVGKLIEKSGKKKVLIVAPLSWKELVEKISVKLGYNYYAPKTVRTQEAKDREVTAISKLLEGDERLVLHISPHTSLGVGVNLVNPDIELDTLVIAPSEAVYPPDSGTVTEAGVIMRKYSYLELSWWKAWFIVNPSRSILRVIQAIGRIQRSEKQKVTLVLIGKYFDKVLSKFYEPLFGSYEIVNPTTSDPEEIVDMISEVIKNR